MPWATSVENTWAMHLHIERAEIYVKNKLKNSAASHRFIKLVFCSTLIPTQFVSNKYSNSSKPYFFQYQWFPNNVINYVVQNFAFLYCKEPLIFSYQRQVINRTFQVDVLSTLANRSHTKQSILISTQTSKCTFYMKVCSIARRKLWLLATYFRTIGTKC